jgi:DNA-directed RNA polymerase subunit H (RpoH/RPB5)
MSEKKELFVIYKSENEKTESILKNVLIMLSNRVYFENNDTKKQLLNYDKAYNNIERKDNNIFIVKANNNEQYVIKIGFDKITSLNTSFIGSLIKDYPTHIKIIVTKEFNKKITQQISVSQNIQIFEEKDMLFDLISHELQPTFEILSPIESEKVKASYNVDEKLLCQISRSDPVTKYFALKKGAMIKVIRSSPISVFNIMYRIVS